MKVARPSLPRDHHEGCSRPRGSHRPSGGLRACSASMNWCARSARSCPPPPNSSPPPPTSASRNGRTYEVRDQLRGLGLRWDPASIAWHGTIRVGEEVVLERELRVAPRSSTRSRRSRPEASLAPPAGPKPPEPRPRAAGEPRGPPRDSSRTRAKGPDGLPRRGRRGGRRESQSSPGYTVWDTTSGLPDDSREADERAAERRLRDLRGRVKKARAALSASPVAEVLRGDWRREAAFYARFGITQAQFREGAASEAVEAAHDGFEGVNSAIGLLSVAVGRKAALLSGPRWRAEGNRIPNTL